MIVDVDDDDDEMMMTTIIIVIMMFNDMNTAAMMKIENKSTFINQCTKSKRESSAAFILKINRN